VADERTTEQKSTPKVDFEVPNSARIWNYWMGGKDNYPVDRVAGDAWAELHPDITVMAKQSRQFLIRVVRYLAGEVGIRQFLDIGTGLPTMQNTHEVAQSIAGDARIVYVDNDPLVLSHARALLTNTTPEGVTTYIDADVHDPEQILADAHNILNLRKPVAVILFDILGHVTDFDEARSITARLMDGLPSGSYLAVQDSTNTSEPARKAAVKYAETGAVPYYMRSPEQIRQYFDGLEMVDPGVVTVTQWRPENSQVRVDRVIDQYGGLARKP
jgi:trans-aconitate methyltransferase